MAEYFFLPANLLTDNLLTDSRDLFHAGRDATKENQNKKGGSNPYQYKTSNINML